MSISVKIHHSPSQVTRKVILSTTPPPSWDRLATAVRTRFTLTTAFGLKYRDPDGDHITISSQLELDELWDEIKAGAKLKEKEGSTRKTVVVELVELPPIIAMSGNPSSVAATLPSVAVATSTTPAPAKENEKGDNNTGKDEWEDAFDEDLAEAIRFSNLETDPSPTSGSAVAVPPNSVDGNKVLASDEPVLEKQVEVEEPKVAPESAGGEKGIPAAPINDPPEELPQTNNQTTNQTSPFAPVLSSVYSALEAAGPEIMNSIENLVGSVLTDFFGDGARGHPDESLHDQIQRVWRAREEQLRTAGPTWARNLGMRMRGRGCGRMGRGGFRRQSRCQDFGGWGPMFGGGDEEGRGASSAPRGRNNAEDDANTESFEDTDETVTPIQVNAVVDEMNVDAAVQPGPADMPGGWVQPPPPQHRPHHHGSWHGGPHRHRDHEHPGPPRPPRHITGWADVPMFHGPPPPPPHPPHGSRPNSVPPPPPHAPQARRPPTGTPRSVPGMPGNESDGERQRTYPAMGAPLFGSPRGRPRPMSWVGPEGVWSGGPAFWEGGWGGAGRAGGSGRGGWTVEMGGMTGGWPR